MSQISETINTTNNQIIKNHVIKGNKKLFDLAKYCMHIIATNGSCVITYDKTTQLLRKNESIYIPKNTTYIIENNCDNDFYFVSVEVIFN